MKLKKFLDVYPIWSAYQLHERLVMPMQKMLKKRDLTFLQSLILAAIHFEGAPVSPSELKSLFGTSLPNMSHSLKHLRLMGFVERHNDNVDARKNRYVITPHAKTCLEHIINVHHHAQENMEKQFLQSNIESWCLLAAKLSQ